MLTTSQHNFITQQSLVNRFLRNENLTEKCTAVAKHLGTLLQNIIYQLSEHCTAVVKHLGTLLQNMIYQLSEHCAAVANHLGTLLHK